MNVFTDKFDRFACVGETLETTQGGLDIVATIHEDSDHGAPWDNEDGHGPVSGWTGRSKRPGELVLTDGNPSGMRGNTRKRYYDYQEACALARRDGWGFLPGPLETSQVDDVWRATCRDKSGGVWSAISDDINEAIRMLYAQVRDSFPSSRAYAAAAARADYETLRAWCNDDWSYCGIVVTVSRDGEELSSDSLWGLELNYPQSGNAYLTETANELASTAISAAPSHRLMILGDIMESAA